MTMKSIGKAQESPIGKKRVDYYKKKLQSRREELMRTIARTEEEGRQADDDQTVDLADKPANSYTKQFLFGMTNTEEHTSELQSLRHLVCRLLLEKKKKIQHDDRALRGYMP